MSWYTYLTAGIGAIGLGALAFIPGAAGVLSAITAAAGPLLKGLAELLVWLVKTFWEGFVDIVDNIATIITVILLSGAIYTYGVYFSPPRTACEAEIVKLVKQVKDLKAQVRRAR